MFEVFRLRLMFMMFMLLLALEIDVTSFSVYFVSHGLLIQLAKL